MKATNMNTESWESLADDRSKWRGALTQHLKAGEKKLMNAAAEKRARRKERINSDRPAATHRCDLCNRFCHSRIGLYSHKRRCSTDD